MSKPLTVILALTAGLAGGILSRYVAPPAAHAQDPQRHAVEVRAESFVLVDSADRTIGTFTSDPLSGPRTLNVPNGSVTIPRQTRIVLRNAAGREIWSAGGTGIHPASER